MILQHQDLNARLILNVQITLHVSKKNAKILASPLLVESMLNAELPDTVQFVTVKQVMRETPIVSVKNVSIRNLK
jgi:hypothetical protein